MAWYLRQQAITRANVNLGLRHRKASPGPNELRKAKFCCAIVKMFSDAWIDTYILYVCTSKICIWVVSKHDMVGILSIHLFTNILLF